MKLILSKPDRNLEESFQFLLEKSKEKPLAIRDLLDIFSGRTRLILIGILCIPFCFPVSIPGLSLAFGLVIAVLSLELLFRIPILLPKKIMDKEISRHTLGKIAELGLKIVRKLKPLIKTRWTRLSYNYIFRSLGYCLIPILALMLALPIPIPMSNMPYSWPILLTSMGLIEDDGLLLLIGETLGLVSITLTFFIVFHLTNAVIGLL